MHANSNWMIKAASLLRDPIMMNWAVRYYAKLPDAEQKAWMNENWFTGPTLNYWLKRGDEIILAHLFRHLPSRHFSASAALIAERWSLWPIGVASVAAKVLASAAAETAAQMFQRFLGQAGNVAFEQPEMVLAILGNLHKLPSVYAKPMSDALLLWMETVRRHMPDALAAGLAAATHCCPERVSDVIDIMFMQIENYDPSAVVAETLLGSSDYIDPLIFGRIGCPSYVSASRFYEADAPLAELDAALRSKDPLPRVMELWRPYRERSTVGKSMWEGMANCKSYHVNKCRRHLTAMGVAMLLSQIEAKQSDIDCLDTAELLSLTLKNVNFDLHFDKIVMCLRQQPRAEVIAHIQARITPRRAPESAAELYAAQQMHKLIRLAGELGWVEFIDILAPALKTWEWEDVGAAQSAAELALKRIGKIAGETLIWNWDNLELDKKWSSASIVAQVGCDGVADFALTRFAELLALDEEIWADLVTIGADARLVERLGQELHRNQEHIDLAYYRLCGLLDITGKEVSALRKRVRAGHAARLDRVKNAETHVNQVDITQLALALKCSECGDTNMYQVKRVIIGRPCAQDPMILADEFPCISCAAWADFALGRSAFRTVSERIALAKSLPPRERASRDKIMALFPQVAVQGHEDDDELGAFPVVYCDLLETLKGSPRDVAAICCLGVMACQAHRPKRALTWFRQAHEIDPVSLSTTWALAAHLELLGERAEAFEILACRVADRKNWKTGAMQNTQFIANVVGMFNQLRIEFGRQDLPPLSLSEAMQTEKTGRNDPCACGSGKKYKKCCGG